MAISLYNDTNENTISFTSDGLSTQVPDVKVINQRAAKASLGSADERDNQTIYKEILSGREGIARRRSAIQEGLAIREEKMAMLRNYAANRGDGPISPDELALVSGLSQETSVNPETVWENQFSNTYLTTALTLFDNPVLPEAMEEDAELAYQAMDIAEFAIARKEIAQKIVEDLEARWDAKDTWWSSTDEGSKAYEVIETFVPFWTWTNLSNALEDKDAASAILPGNNVKEQMDYLFSLSPDEFQRQFKQAVDTIAESNLVDAMEFARAATAYSTSDQLLNNAFAMFDIADVASLGAAGVATRVLKGGKVGKLSKALKETVKSVAARNLDAGEAMSSLGSVERGSLLDALKAVNSKLDANDTAGQLSALKKELPTLFNPERIIEGKGTNFGRESLTRIMASLDHSREHLLRTVTDLGHVERLPTQQAINRAVMQTVERVQRQYGVSTNDAILDFAYISNERSLGNVASVDISLGLPDGTMFKSERKARYYARDIYKLPEDSYTVRQNGFGFTLSVVKDIDETDSAVRSLLIDTNNTTPQSFANTFIGALRTPEDTLSEFQKANRHMVTHATPEMQRLIKESVAEIGALSKASRNDLRRFLEMNRDYVRPGTQERGRFFDTLGEMEKEWSTAFGRLPTEREAAAYFQYVQLNNLDLVHRNLALYRDLARQGIERVSIKVRSVDPETGKAGFSPTTEFQGKLVDDIPWDATEDAGIYIYNRTTNKPSFIKKNSVTAISKKEVERLKADGYKIVQVADPSNRAFADSVRVKGTVNFVIAKDVNFSRLDFNLIPNRPGGHVVYPQQYFTKQGKVYTDANGKTHYSGDTAIFPHTTEAEAKKFSTALEEARVHYKEGRVGRAQEIVEDRLPFSMDEFTKLFETLPGHTAPRLSLDSPIAFTRSGQSIKSLPSFQRSYPDAVDETTSQYNLLNQASKSFLQDRDLTLDAVREGGEGDVLFSLETAKLLDPLATTRRALTDVTRNRLINDYKISAVESFVEEFYPVLKGTREELRQNPMGALYNPQWKDGADLQLLAAAKNFRRATLQLIGTKTPTQEALSWMKSKLLNQVYRVGGQGAAEVSEALLGRVKDPFVFMRQVAFHTKLGMFNPVQFFLQQQTMAHIAAIVGFDNGAKSVGGAYLMRAAGLTDEPEVIQALAKAGEAIGWKADEFLESYNEMRKSGIFNIQGEVAWRDDVIDPPIFKGAVGNTLDKSLLFFTEGERLTRMAGWNAAYREWRKANPGKTITNRDRQQILLRQNTLTVNMTRASNSMWQQGPASSVTQFFGYQTRLFEQLWGGRLTAAEKARVFGMYSAMYGVPTASGAVTGLYPIGEDIRQYMLEKNIPFDDTALEAVMDGIPSVMLEYLTGSDANWGERYGPGGLPFFKDLFNGDLEAAEVALGASGSIFWKDILTTSLPPLKGVFDVFSDTDEDNRYPILASDWINFASNISSVNNAVRSYYMFNTGKYISRNGVVMDGVNTADAIFTAIMGTTPQAISDDYLRIQSMKSQKEGKEYARKQFVIHMRKGMTAQDVETRDKELRAARIWVQVGGFRPDEYKFLLRDVGAGLDLGPQIRFDFWLQNPNKE